MSVVQIFVSFDTENDQELYELLLEQSENAASGFTVSGCSERAATNELSSERSRRRIRAADQVIVICGEHTNSSVRVSVEVGLAQQEGTPYFLLWGRRDHMCTKPVGSKNAEGMYSWTRQILQEQIAFTVRKSVSDAAANAMREARLKGRSNPPSTAP
jgi:hypothetical protein